MNIHFSDEATFDILKKSTLASIRMGSHLYGLNDEHSDTDLLCITAPAENEQLSFSFTHHQMQYKDVATNTDYIFINIFNFLRNTINGDSTINFEVLHSDAIKETPLSFLADLSGYFSNFPIIRSYLGLARRDIKLISKATGDRDKNKKLMHAYRGYYFAQHIFKNTFSNQLPSDLQEELLSIKSITDYKVRYEKVSYIQPKIDEYRTEMRQAMERNEISSFMSVKGQQLLDEQLRTFFETDFYKSKVQPFLDLTPIYEANERGIRY